MSHYRTGTVNVTNGSLSVVGVGTDFIAGAAIGECLAAPDGKLYEIASIQSATGLTLGTGYLGATVTGQAYSIIPTQSYIRDLALQAATLVNGYQAIVGGPGSGKFDDGTVGSPGIQFAADANTGIRRTGTDAVAVVTGGVDRITVSSAGVVAVPGNTALGDQEASDTHAIKGATTLLANSASAALTVTQTGAGNAFVVEDSATPDTTPFAISAAGLMSSGGPYYQSADYGEVRFRGVSGANLNGWRLVHSINGASDGNLVLQHTTDNFSANFIDALTLGVDGASSVKAHSASAALTVTQTGAGNAFVVEDSASTDSTPFVIDASGNLSTYGVASLIKSGTSGYLWRGYRSTSTSTLYAYDDGTDVQITMEQAGSLKLGTSNATRVTIDANGATSIAAVSGDALKVTNTGSGNSFVVEDSASTDSTPFVVNAAGIVNVAHPTAITGALAAVMHLQVAKTDSEAIGAYMFNASSSGPALEFGQSNNSTVGSHTVVASGDNLGVIRFSGSDGTNFIRGAHIVCAVDGTPGTNDMPGRLIFSTTADGASSPTERMRIDSAGNVGIGATSASISLRVAKSVTGGTIAYGVVANGQVQTDVTVGSYGFASLPSFANYAAAQHKHFDAAQGTISGTLTDQKAFSADSSLTGATNNYGFYSNIAAAANRFNFYAAGTADNYFAGSVGIGSTPVTGYKVLVYGTHTGSTTYNGVASQSVAASDVTANYNAFRASATTAAASFTLPSLSQFIAEGSTTGAGSTITNQFGFNAAANLTNATNNYGFYSNIASAANRYNFYAAGTAQNYFGGTTSVGGTTGQAKFNSEGSNDTIMAYAASPRIYLNPSSANNKFRIAAQDAASNTLDISVSTTAPAGDGVALTYSAVFGMETSGAVTTCRQTAIPAGGTTSVGMKVSTTANFGVFFGSGAPTLSAAKGSLYLRSDGSTTNDRMYVNTNGTTTWTAVVTAA